MVAKGFTRRAYRALLMFVLCFYFCNLVLRLKSVSVNGERHRVLSRSIHTPCQRGGLNKPINGGKIKTAMSRLLRLRGGFLVNSRELRSPFSMPNPIHKVSRPTPEAAQIGTTRISDCTSSLNAEEEENAGGGEGSSVRTPTLSDSVLRDPALARSTFNLIKNIIGAAVLSLASGVACFSDSKYALIPATVITAILGFLSSYTFALICRCCEMNGVYSYGEAWNKSVGPSTAWIVNAACVFKTFFGSISYLIIIGDSVVSILKSLGCEADRSKTIVATGVLMMPLCLLKSFDILVYPSLFGIFGTLGTGILMGWRCFDGSYREGGRFLAMLPKAGRPVFGEKPKISVPLMLILVSMLGTGFNAHYNAPKFYQQMRRRSVARLNNVVSTAFAFVIITYFCFMTFGFLTFGGVSCGHILNNYAESDQMMMGCHLAIASSIAFGFPFVFMGAKDNIINCLGITEPSDRFNDVASFALMTLLVAFACQLTDLGVVVSATGAIFGTALIYIFPAIMFIQTIKGQIESGALARTEDVRRELMANYGITVLGFIMSLIGGGICFWKEFKDR